MTTDRTTFYIPEANMPRFEREVAKLSKKAEKYGGWSFAPLIVGIQMRDNSNGTQTKVFEVNLDVGEIKLGDWTFLARIDHSQETGNIIRSVPNEDKVSVEERFRHTAPNCEHCNQNRKRRDTFVLVNNETGEMKQVGSTCLVDFLGHNAAELGRIAEYAGYANELARASESDDAADPKSLYDHRYIILSEYLAYCAASVRLYGWVSGKAAYENPSLVSTRKNAFDMMVRQSDVVEAEDHVMVEKALEWARNFENKDNLSDYEHNVLVIANASVIEGRACGLAASIVGVYASRVMERPRAAAVKLDNMEALIALFDTAGSRLKNPKIIVYLPNVGEIELNVAKATHKVPGSINVKRHGWGAPWYGRILRDGSFHPVSNAPAGLSDDLLTLSADPAGVIGKSGHHTGRCCMCNLPLTDAVSRHYGYGATCAKNYGLEYNKKVALA